MFLVLLVFLISAFSAFSAFSAVKGGGKICFWAENHVSEIDLTKFNHFLTKINENMNFHTHFIDFGGGSNDETSWKC